MPIPGPSWGFPTKDEFAGYLESYAERFEMPVRTGVRIERLTRNGKRYVATAGDQRFEADNVVIAMSSWQRPRTPQFASQLDPGIVQLHAADYRNPSQLQKGDVVSPADPGQSFSACDYFIQAASGRFRYSP